MIYSEGPRSPMPDSEISGQRKLEDASESQSMTKLENVSK